MDNPESILQSLENFSRTKSKEIPKELEEYISYVARTGDPVFQWSSVKVLLKEKLLSILNEFYRANPSLDIPHYPNVDPFDYEGMKNHLINRLESFVYAPFTIQRICELLSTPRKEYSRIDKYMRAIEKNVSVITSRDVYLRKSTESENSGTATDTAVLNGIFYRKINHFANTTTTNHIYCSDDNDVDDKINNTTSSSAIHGMLEWHENDSEAEYKINDEIQSSVAVSFPDDISFDIKEDEEEEEEKRDSGQTKDNIDVSSEIDKDADTSSVPFVRENEFDSVENVLNEPVTATVPSLLDNSDIHVNSEDNFREVSDKTETVTDDIIINRELEPENVVVDEFINEEDLKPIKENDEAESETTQETIEADAATDSLAQKDNFVLTSFAVESKDAENFDTDNIESDVILETDVNSSEVPAETDNYRVEDDSETTATFERKHLESEISEMPSEISSDVTSDTANECESNKSTFIEDSPFNMAEEVSSTSEIAPEHTAVQSEELPGIAEKNDSIEEQQSSESIAKENSTCSSTETEGRTSPLNTVADEANENFDDADIKTMETEN